jgi:protein gp37
MLKPKTIELITFYYACYILHKINLTRTDVLNTTAMKISEIYNTDENIGPAPKGACSKPMSSLPASWVSSCKSQGRMKRTGDRKQKIGGKTQKVAGKRIKGRAYGGPLPDYSA